jgi:MFS family permease
MATVGHMDLSPTENYVSQRSLRGLDWLNFFLAGLLTGLGPFVALYLAGRGWTHIEIGFVLTIGVLTGLLVQVPAGEVLDMTASKRLLIAIGVVTLGFATLILALLPTFAVVLIVEVLLGVTGGFLMPAVTAMSLGLVGNAGLPERLGRNQRFAATGGFVTAALMGLLGYILSNETMFFVGAALALPTLFALRQIHNDDIHFANACGGSAGDYHPKHLPRSGRRAVGTHYDLLVFATCIVLFQLANASALPLVSEELGGLHGSSLVLSAIIFVPQIVVAILAPRVGLGAKSWGRRPLLLIGLCALPIRAACFAFIRDPVFLIPVQLLDGVSAAAIGVLTPLIIADITKGSGRFNLAQGIVGTFSGIGAALSTTLSGYVAQSFGSAAGFYAITGVALVAVAVCWVFMPETRSAGFMAPAATGRIRLSEAG